ncbi:MAG: hypothetical protein ACLR56_06250 [Oscillospiraceae bacterium]
MSGIGALISLIKLGSVPLVALPVNAVLRQILVKALPPNRVIIRFNATFVKMVFFFVLSSALKFE